MPLATHLETLEGRRVRVARLGTGPPLVLLHGYPENLQLFSRLAPLLAASHEVIAFDWPGLGESEAWPGGASPFDLADRLQALLDTWKLSRATVVGMDMGAPPALVLAARPPELIDYLIIMNSLLFADEATSWEIRLLRRPALNALALQSFPRLAFRRALATALPPGEGLEDGVEQDLWRSFRRPGVRAFLVRLCAGYTAAFGDVERAISCVRVPLLALWGERDRHFPPVHGERLHAAVPGSQLRVIPGAGHWMAWSHAAEVAARIRAYVESGRE